jgi:hypothetical protein
MTGYRTPIGFVCAALLALGFASPQARASAQAPAPAPAPAPSGGGDINSLFQNPYSGEENDLGNPNRTSEEITSWAQQRAAEVMSFTAENLNDKARSQLKDFNEQGLAEYKKYMTDSRLLEMVRSQQYTVTTIANGDALVLNSGSIGGAYHWIVELPIMVTFHHMDVATNEAKPVAGGEFKLVVDVGRVLPKDGVDGLQIMSWKMEPKTASAQ